MITRGGTEDIIQANISSALNLLQRTYISYFIETIYLLTICLENEKTHKVQATLPQKCTIAKMTQALRFEGNMPNTTTKMLKTTTKMPKLPELPKKHKSNCLTA